MWKKVLACAFFTGSLQLTYIPPTNVSSLKLFSGSCNRDLSNEVAGILGVQLGRIRLSKFQDGEINISIFEDVSDKDVFIISPLGSPIHDSIVELLLMISAFRRSNCRKIILIIPYLAYSRQDTPSPGGFYCPAEDIPRLLESMQLDAIVGIDFHGSHVDGHFSVPVHEIKPYSLAVEYLKTKKLRHPVVISPDIRGASRAYEFYRILSAAGVHCDLAVLPNPGASMSYLTSDNNFLGNKLTGRDVIIVDDMMITGSTVLKCLEIVRKQDAERVFAYATHPVLPGGSYRMLERSSLDEYICTNSLKLEQSSNKIVQISVAGVIAQKILEIFEKNL